jgi:hypothetical protein
MDLVEIGMALYGIGSLIIAIAVIAWPLESERGEVRRILRARWPR